MSKKSKMRKGSGKIEISKRVIVMAELVEEGVKESRADDSYSRKQNGKARDAARREQSRNNRRKSNRHNN